MFFLLILKKLLLRIDLRFCLPDSSNVINNIFNYNTIKLKLDSDIYCLHLSIFETIVLPLKRHIALKLYFFNNFNVCRPITGKSISSI